MLVSIYTWWKICTACCCCFYCRLRLSIFFVQTGPLSKMIIVNTLLFCLKNFTQGWPGIYYIKMLGQLLGRSFFSRFQTDKNTTQKNSFGKAMEPTLALWVNFSQKVHLMFWLEYRSLYLYALRQSELIPKNHKLLFNEIMKTIALLRSNLTYCIWPGPTYG